MKFGSPLQRLKASVCRPQFLLAGSLAAFATAAIARAPNSVPEPSILTLVGAGMVAGIIAYRIKKKK